MNGTHEVSFALYDVPTAGVPTWSESASVSFAQGAFAHALGSATSLVEASWRTSADLWLEITAEGQPSTRVPVAFSARALHAVHAASLGGRPAGDYRTVDWTPSWSDLAGAPADSSPLTSRIESVAYNTESELTAALNDNYTYAAGNGLDLNGSSFVVAPSEIYEALDARYQPLTAYTAANGVNLTGTVFSVDQTWLNARYAPVGAPSSTAGTVAQIVLNTSTTTATLDTTTFTEPNSSYRVTVTPKLANSRFIIEYQFPMNTATAANTIMHMQLVRNIGGSEVLVGVGPTNGSRQRTTWVGRPGNGWDTNDLMLVNFQAVDTGLAVGTPVTYGFKYRREGGGSGTAYFNYSAQDNAVYGFSGMMTMQVTEIAQ